MKTIPSGVARRRETTEAVRGRLENLYPISLEPRQPALRPPESGLIASPDAAPPPEPPSGSPRPAGRWWSALRPHPALALDRRALVGLGVLLVLAAAYAVQHFWLGRPKPVAIPVAAAVTLPAQDGSPADPMADPSPTTLVIDVAGRVRSPGLRSLPNGSRIADALQAAGGPLPETDTDNLNLARVLSDGEQILVGIPVPPSVSDGGSPGTPVSLNHATLEQLDTLPGVGPALARRILRYRQQHGAFRSVDQLRQVGGIGEQKFQDLRPLLAI